MIRPGEGHNDNNPIAALTWWEGSCQINDVMVDQADETVRLVLPGDPTPPVIPKDPFFDDAGQTVIVCFE